MEEMEEMLAEFAAAHAGREATGAEAQAEVRSEAAAALAALLGAVRERAARWPDFVFTPEYAACARRFGDVMRYVRQNGHLPYIRPASQVRWRGGGREEGGFLCCFAGSLAST